MVYRVIGLMSGSSLDGLDIAFVEFQENAGKWGYEIKAAECYSYTEEWVNKLKNAISLNGMDYQLLHTDFGHYIGKQINKFIEEKKLHYQVALIASHGHTTFHVPAKKMTAQLGDGAAIAAVTQLPVVADLRALDVALGGQGAPIVPIGEKLLLGGYDYFLNLGGIANISHNADPSTGSGYIAFDVCPANRVLNTSRPSRTPHTRPGAAQRFPPAAQSGHRPRRAGSGPPDRTRSWLCACHSSRPAAAPFHHSPAGWRCPAPQSNWHRRRPVRWRRQPRRAGTSRRRD